MKKLLAILALVLATKIYAQTTVVSTSPQLLYQVDFTAIGSQSLTSGTNVINGKTWRIFLGGSSTAALTSGTGLVLTGQDNSNAVEMILKLTNVHPDWDPTKKTKVSVRLGFPAAFDGDFDWWWLALGWDTGSSYTDRPTLYGRQYRSGTGDKWRVYDLTSYYDALDNSSYTVQTLTWDDTGGSALNLIGTWSSGFPRPKDMQLHSAGRAFAAYTLDTSHNPSTRAIAFSVGGTGMSVEVKALKIEQQ